MHRNLPVLLGAMLLGACTSQQTPLAVDVLLNEPRCAWREAGVHRLDAGQLRRLTERKLLLDPKQPRDDVIHTNADEPEQPASSQGALLLLVSKGSQPTPGYGFDFVDAHTDAANDAFVRLRWRTPEPGSVQAQVITNPCIVLGLPQGDYGRVHVEDDSGLSEVLTLTRLED